MPRVARAVVDGGCYHVLNRGNARSEIFHKPADFEAFLRVVGEAQHRYPVDLLAWCLMSNHWHLILRPRKAAALAEFMRWVGVTHVRRYQEHYQQRGGGHLYQGRFKSFLIQSDEHFLTVCRYVEANPLRARLVRRAENWAWSSLGYDPGEHAPLVVCADWPVDRPRDWAALVNRALPEAQADAIRTSIARDRPFGEAQWVLRTAKRLGLLSTLRPRGRPRKERK
jgi:putative transposase